MLRKPSQAHTDKHCIKCGIWSGKDIKVKRLTIRDGRGRDGKEESVSKRKKVNMIKCITIP